MEKITIPLRYGQTTLSIELPTGKHSVLEKQKISHHMVSEERLIQEALSNPIGSAALRELAAPGDKIAVIVSDLTRPCPTDRLLPYIINELSAADIPSQDITIILALGLHRPMTAAEMQRACSRDSGIPHFRVSSRMELSPASAA